MTLTAIAIYKLRPIVEDPALDGFGEVGDSRSLVGNARLVYDFLPFRAPDGTWKTHRLSDVWKPVEVAGNERGDNDYPTIGFIIPVFSDRAVEALLEFLAPNGELLPLRAPAGSYFAYNVTTLVADALDPKRTRRRGANMIEYHFIPDMIAGFHLFRLAGDATSLFVSQVFVDRAIQTNLRGLDLKRVWSPEP